MKNTNTRRLFVLIIAALIIFGPSILALYVDYLWFNEVLLTTIFSTILSTKLIIGINVGFAVALLLFANILLFKRLSGGRPIMFSMNRGDHVQMIDVTRTFNRIIAPITIGFGLLLGYIASQSWETILLYKNQSPFGITDPIFDKDISYYIFSLPFFELVMSLAYMVIAVALIGTIVLYLMQGTLTFKNRRALSTSLAGSLVEVGRGAKMHLSFLFGLWFLLAAGNTYLVKIPSLLYGQTGPIYGASYTDVHAVLPMLYVLIAIALLGVLASVISTRRGGVSLIIGSFVLYALVQFVGGFAYPAILQNLIVKPNEFVKETPYIRNHIDLTQAAWGLSEIEKRDLPGSSSLTMDDILANRTTVENIRLWDRDPLLDTFGQLQEIRTYYDFVSVDNDRYMLDGRYRQVLLSPRELNSASLPQRNFINEHLTFTHGMGITLSPVNEVTKEGLPVLFVKDLPPQSSLPEIAITRPELYYGELVNDYAIVNTDAKEFDYPSGEGNVYSTYEGTGGVNMEGILRKLIFSLHFSSLKIMLSNDISRDSRIIYHRDIRSRAKKALPFLTFDSDPYLVVDDGKLFYMLDAYTHSNNYPYSQPMRGINYMRNTVKVVIDAYNGTVTAYISQNEPIIDAYERIFPDVFKQLSEMPESLQAHVRYPEDLFAMQTTLFTTYHMENEQDFYNKEDEWEIPVIPGSAQGRNADPVMRHLIMKLPGEDTEEFILMLPFTPRQKNNMAAWMVARSDGDHYGEMVVYRFPKQKLVYGPKQIVDRINQDADISRQISLWDQRGSQVNQGNLFVIPINESILYVRPLYLRAEGGKIPELKRVIVAYENQIAMEETLDESLAKIFGIGNYSQPTSTTPETPSLDDLPQSERALLEKARTHFNKAQDALRIRDWNTYGTQMRELEEMLNTSL